MDQVADRLTASPFHHGERAIQERLGVAEQVEDLGRRMIRDHMPDQHRDFYAALPFLFVGSVDAEGRPWASVVAGAPGFVSSPDANTLTLAAHPHPADPLAQNIVPGAPLGLLGLDFATRRRNRMNGAIAGLTVNGFTITVDQSFGNCPQYIQARTVEPVAPDAVETAPERIVRSARLETAQRAIIAAADTFFIATHFAEGEDTPTHGADVSRRGGKPGFVRIEDDGTLSWPDLHGNNHFNTLGNILVNPRAGLLFIDFESRDLLFLTGTAEIVWDGPEVEAFEGADRIVRFRLDQAIHAPAALPVRWRFEGNSPILSRTGTWQTTEAAVAAETALNAKRTLIVEKIVEESETIRSFYLAPADGKPLPAYRPGQFLPLSVDLPGSDETVLRTYTLSDAPGGASYRISVKRETDGFVAAHLHENVEAGSRLNAAAPRGSFTLAPGDRPVVLLSAGVGITPMVAMLNQIVADGAGRPVWFVHGTRNGREHAFGPHVRDLAERVDGVTAHVRYSRPDAQDRPGVDFDSTGHVDVDLLRSLLPFGDYDFYLCGPGAFMQTLYRVLRGLNVAEDRIHYEFFGPATVLKDPDDAVTPVADTEAAPVAVRFDRADKTADWKSSSGSLLDLAEAEGLTPAYSCRSGICGTCAVGVVSGAVDYVEEPLATPEPGQALICCATPREGLVLDL